MQVVVIGGGVFGLAGALELRSRGHRVLLFEPGPIPRPEASSTDLSRAVRMDYGADEFYAELAAAAIARWPAWNVPGRPPVYHPDGFLLLTRGPLSPGTYEGDGHAVLSARGHDLDELDAATIEARFPAFRDAGYAGGYYNPIGGWVDAAEAVRRLAEQATACGVEHRPVAVDGLEREAGRVVGVCGGGVTCRADLVVVAAGAWTPQLVPELSDRLRPTGQPVTYFEVADESLYQAPGFAPFGAEIAATGWYGFPACGGLLKVANHGPGIACSPDGPREVPAAAEDAARRFVAETFPALARAPLVDRRLCFYCDSFDGDFWIARSPEDPGLMVASGGSGHGFKFAPLVGEWIADVAEGRDDPRLARFAWRNAGARRAEGARRCEE